MNPHYPTGNQDETPSFFYKAKDKISITYEPTTTGNTNPVLTPHNIVSAGPCADPNCERCHPKDTAA